MRVLMISADRWFLNEKQMSDVIERHKIYSKNVTRLDIIVQCKGGFRSYTLSENAVVHPTSSLFKIFYVRDTLIIAKELIASNHYDVIVTQDPFLTGLAGMKIKKLLKVKLIVNLHGDFIDNPLWEKRRLINKILLRLAKHVFASADGIRVMSEGQKKKLDAKQYKAVISVISTPVNIDNFLNYETTATKQWPTIVTMAGRKDPIKDFPMLFKAMDIVFKTNDTVGLYLVGNYSDDNAIPLPKDRVRLFGNVAGSDMPAIYKVSDIVVLPSISESFGKVLVEANASGKPVVATATTGAKEIIQDGYNGYLVPIGDSKAFANKITYLVDNPSKAIAMGANGRVLVKERYSNNTEKIIQFWKDIVNN